MKFAFSVRCSHTDELSSQELCSVTWHISGWKEKKMRIFTQWACSTMLSDYWKAYNTWDLCLDGDKVWRSERKSLRNLETMPSYVQIETKNSSTSYKTKWGIESNSCVGNRSIKKSRTAQTCLHSWVRRWTFNMQLKTLLRKGLE